MLTNHDGVQFSGCYYYTHVTGHAECGLLAWVTLSQDLCLGPRTTRAGADLVNTYQQMTRAINTHKLPISELAALSIIYSLLTDFSHFSDHLSTLPSHLFNKRQRSIFRIYFLMMTLKTMFPSLLIDQSVALSPSCGLWKDASSKHYLT